MAASVTNEVLLQQIVGHGTQITGLWEAVGAEHLPSTLLFTGPDGVGRRQVARALAQRLVCDAPEMQKLPLLHIRLQSACGRCGPCRRMAAGQSEGWVSVAPEKAQIRVEQVEPLFSATHLALLGRARVMLIESAETLNPTAANMLLKLLEEPPPATYFILLAPSPRHVLPTVRSRSQIVSFQALSVEEMRQVRPQMATWMLQASRGQFSELQTLADPELQQERQRSSQALDFWLQSLEQPGLESSPLGYLRELWREPTRDRAGARALAQQLFGLCRDAVVWQQSPRAPLLHPEQQALVQRLAAFPAARLFKWGELALEWEQQAARQMDPQLLAEQFWLKARTDDPPFF